MAKWITAEKVRAGLGHTVICPNVTGRTKKRIVQSKRPRAGSLAIVDTPQVEQNCILRPDVVLSFSDATFVLCFCFVFVIFMVPLHTPIFFNMPTSYQYNSSNGCAKERRILIGPW